MQGEGEAGAGQRQAQQQAGHAMGAQRPPRRTPRITKPAGISACTAHTGMP
jgi:hypothetical protein